MARQLGAQHIDIDTEESYVKFAVLKPGPIDFAAVERAAEDAAYTLSVFELQLRGHTFAKPCETCGGDVPALEVAGTGQILELVGEVPLDRDLLLSTSVIGWTGAHPQLEVLEFSEP